MPDLAPILSLFGLLPFDCLQARFMQQAMLGLVLLAPMAAVMGVQVVNMRMAFFSDAISHSAFAGVAIGLILSIDPDISMPVFGILVGLAIVGTLRRTSLSSDTVIGVIFSAVMAFGLAVVSRHNTIARDLQQFLYGDILTISQNELWCLLAIFVVLILFQLVGYNRLLYVSLDPVLARAHRVRVALYQYCFAALLALVVMFSVRAVGVLLVTAMLIVPAASARNLAGSSGSMFWWSLLVGLSSAMCGLILSAQEWVGTTSGAVIILISCLWFLVSLGVSAIRGDRVR